MKINGISYAEFFKATKAAFSSANISEIKRDSIVKKFLTHQLFPNQNPGENEARLPELFNAHDDENPNMGSVVMLEMFGTDERGNTMSEGLNTYICISTDAINAKLRYLFSANYPDYSGQRMLESYYVTETISSLADDEEDEEKMIEDIERMSSDEIETWLLENIDIDTLVSDDFFCDFLHAGMLKISYDFTNIDY